jgi:hypothetical protein
LLAGSSFKINRTPEAYELRLEVPGGRGKALTYSFSSPPIGRVSLHHLCLGLGLPKNALCRADGRWIHFGGALYSRLLELGGIDTNPLSSSEDPRKALTADLEKIVDRHWERLERLCSFGPFHGDLPRPIRKAAVKVTVPIDAFRKWLDMLEECPISLEQRSILLDWKGVKSKKRRNYATGSQSI